MKFGAACVALSVLLVAGCGGGAESTPTESTPTESTPTESTPTESTPTESTPAALKSGTVGVVVHTGADPNQVNIVKGWESELAKLGDFDVVQVDTGGDASKANAAIQAFVRRGVDAIAVLVYEASALTTGLQTADEADVPVVLNGSNSLAPGVIATLPVYSGEAQTTRMVEDMGGQGSVLMFTFHPGAPCVAQEEGADAVLAEYSGIETSRQEVPAPGWIGVAETTTAAWLRSHPVGGEPLAIWGCWDGPLIGAIAALRAADRNDVLLYGNGGQSDALAAIKKGEITATQFYGDRTGDGELGAQILADYFDTVATGDAWEPVIQPVPSETVDASNVDAACAEFPGYCQ